MRIRHFASVAVLLCLVPLTLGTHAQPRGLATDQGYVGLGMAPPTFHEENFQALAEALRDHTRRVVVSVVDMYRKIEKRLRELEGTPAEVRPCDAEDFGPLLRRLALDGWSATRLQVVL